MKRETTPTSPKYKNKPKSKHNRWPFISVVLAIVFGFVSGFLGSVIRESYSIDYSLPEVITPQEEIVIIKEKSNSAHAAAIDKVIEKTKPSLFNVYSDSYQGAAAVLTSDGWLVTSLVSLPEDFTLINKDKKEYSPDKIITDAWSGLTFIKIDAQNLSVAEFAWPEKGEELLTYYYTPQNEENLVVNYLTNNNYYSDQLRTTTNYSRKFLLNQNLSTSYQSAPVINLTGQIIGFYYQDNQILPAEIISNLANQVIKNNEIKNVDLGVSYYDLAYSYNLDKENNEGALVSKVTLTNGLELDDIILKVEDTEIDEYNDLNYSLQKYYDQDTLNLTILREGEEIELEISQS